MIPNRAWSQKGGTGTKMKNVLTQIERTYRSYESPEFFFVSPYKHLVQKISACFQVEEDTDPNDDVSFGYLLRAKYRSGAKRDQQWLLRLSMVGPYAVLFRLLHTETGVPTVISYTEPVLSELECSPWEKYLLNTLSLLGICLMDRQSLMQPVPMILFKAEPEKTPNGTNSTY